MPQAGQVGQVDIVCAIIAGGNATRLQGREKALLPVGGVAIIDRQLAVLAPLFSRILVVTPRPEPFVDRPVTVIPDRTPGAGPLGGIDAALAALEGAEQGAFCVAADLPFLSAEVIQALLNAAHTEFQNGTAQAVAFRRNGFPEPLSACYSRFALPTVMARLAAQAHKATALLESLPTHWLDENTLRTLDPNDRHFQNINTEAAWRDADATG